MVQECAILSMFPKLAKKWRPVIGGPALPNDIKEDGEAEEEQKPLSLHLTEEIQMVTNH